MTRNLFSASWGNSFCKLRYFHLFEFLEETPHGYREICKKCKKIITIKKYNGIVNNREYAKYHYFEYLQPNQKQFYEEQKWREYFNSIKPSKLL